MLNVNEKVVLKHCSLQCPGSTNMNSVGVMIIKILQNNFWLEAQMSRVKCFVLPLSLPHHLLNSNISRDICTLTTL